MSEVIQIGDLVFAVRRSARRRTIGVTVERDKSLVVHLPQGIALPDASIFIREKLVWVYQKLAGRPGSGEYQLFRAPDFVDGEGFHFLGQHYRLKLVDVPADEIGVPTVRLAGDRLLLRREQAVAGEKRIAEYYTRAAHPYLNSTVQKWKKVVGVEPAKFVQVMDLGFRWASCSENGSLNFHWRIMQLPPRIIDYIVVHELVHLEISDHSPSFWARLERVMPDYQARRQWLKEKGGEL